MNEQGMIPPDETGNDQVLSLTIPDRNARGRMVRLGPVLETILKAHAYPPAITHLLEIGRASCRERVCVPV